MENQQIYGRLTAVFEDVFGEEDIKLKPDMTADDLDGWDSLTHVRLVLAVAKAFDIKFSAADVAGLKNVGDLVRVIEAKT